MASQNDRRGLERAARKSSLRQARKKNSRKIRVPHFELFATLAFELQTKGEHGKRWDSRDRSRLTEKKKCSNTMCWHLADKQILVIHVIRYRAESSFS